MRRNQLVSKCAGTILDAVREERDNLRFISVEVRVNRKYFNEDHHGPQRTGHRFFNPLITPSLYRPHPLSIERWGLCKRGVEGLKDITDYNTFITTKAYNRLAFFASIRSVATQI